MQLLDALSQTNLKPLCTLWHCFDVAAPQSAEYLCCNELLFGVKKEGQSDLAVALQAHAEACVAVGHAELARALPELNPDANEGTETVLRRICSALADAFFPR